MKIQKKWGGVGLGGGGGVQCGCESRSEAFVKIKKKYFIFLGGGGVGGRVRGGGVGLGVSGWMGTENQSFCENSKKKNLGGRGSGRVGLGGGRLVGGQGGCEHRSEVFVKIQKK